MKVEMAKLVTFRIGADSFAAEVFAVERALRYAPPNVVPDVPEWVEGVMEYGGGVIPVVDLRRRIGLDAAARTAETRILVFGARDGRVGAVVDAVQEVASVPAASIAPPPAMFRGLAAEFVRGIAKVRDQLVVVLDVDRVLSSADRIAFERALDAVDAREGVASRG
jgi:purine-binding chemotaxis protein CheW